MIDKAISVRPLDLTDFVIRQVTKADLPALEWDGEYLKYRRMFASLYHNTLLKDTLMWIIEKGKGEMVGQAFVALRSNEKEVADGKTRAYVFSFRVKPQWRNRGIGSHLMHFVENDLRERNFKYVTLNVAKENQDALRLYQRLGYRITGSRPGNWSFTDHEGRVQHVHEPSWRMIKDLS